MDKARPLGEILADLTSDPEARAAYRDDPDGYLSSAGYRNFSTEEAGEAITHHADRLPPELAEQLAPVVMAHSPVTAALPDTHHERADDLVDPFDLLVDLPIVDDPDVDPEELFENPGESDFGGHHEGDSPDDGSPESDDSPGHPTDGDPAEHHEDELEDLDELDEIDLEDLDELDDSPHQPTDDDPAEHHEDELEDLDELDGTAHQPTPVLADLDDTPPQEELDDPADGLDEIPEDPVLDLDDTPPQEELDDPADGLDDLDLDDLDLADPPDLAGFIDPLANPDTSDIHDLAEESGGVDDVD